MKIGTLLAIVCVACLGAACTDTQHYPLSGSACAPTDPVREISVQDCAPLA